VDADGQRELIQAAADAGVKHFVLDSLRGNIRSDDPLTSGKRRAEQALIDSGMTYTILRPSSFMEAWLSSSLGFDYANGRVQIFGSGDQKISWISLSDVARFAADVLENPSAENATMS
jgi:NADH dehydrogenase